MKNTFFALLFLLPVTFLACSDYRKDGATEELKEEFPSAAKIRWVKSEGVFGPDVYIIVDSNYTVRTVKFTPNGGKETDYRK